MLDSFPSNGDTGYLSAVIGWTHHAGVKLIAASQLTKRQAPRFKPAPVLPRFIQRERSANVCRVGMSVEGRARPYGPVRQLEKPDGRPTSSAEASALSSGAAETYTLLADPTFAPRMSSILP